MTPQLALLIAINRAELDGFPHFAAALRQLYQLQFGSHRLPA